jgi:hypothetical protein
MKSDMVKSFVIVMLLLQAVATAFLWILNVLSVETTGVFAVLLAANLLAFATVLRVYRNPDAVDGGPVAKETAPTITPAIAPEQGTAPAPAVAPAPAPAAPPKEMMHSESSPSYGSAALPRLIHIGIPIASIFVVLAFAIVALFLPADKSTLPVESTTLFIPVYLAIVVALVLGSMYLFKRVMDTEDAPPAQ